MTLAHPASWAVVEERSDPERGDVLILGNETSALLVALLHDTRTPREMSQDLIQTQKEMTPDLAVVQSEETSAGSILMFLQYTIRPESGDPMLIDEKALVGTLALAIQLTIEAVRAGQAGFDHLADAVCVHRGGGWTRVN